MKLTKLQKTTLIRDYILLLNSMGYEMRDVIGKPLSYFCFNALYENLFELNEEFFQNNKCYYFTSAPIYQNCFDKHLNLDIF